ncbi:hypothetical protein D3C81_1698700 [compost metagenome]
MAFGSNPVGLLQTFSNNYVAEQASNDTGIFIFITYQFRSDADKSFGSFDHPPVTACNLPGPDNIQRQKRCPTQLALFQKSNRLPGYSFIIHNDMLQ